MTRCFVYSVVLALTLPLALSAQRPGDLRREGKLKVGDAAPDFKLKLLDGKKEVQLASFKGQKPVVLVFGSYT